MTHETLNSHMSRHCKTCGRFIGCGSGRERVFCNWGCFKTYNLAEHSPRWNGGRSIGTRGMIVLSIGQLSPPDHVLLSSSDLRHGYVLEHRLIMARQLGRPLNAIEVVHHIDGNNQNNNPANLLLLPNNGEHTKMHRKQWVGCADCGKRVWPGQKLCPSCKDSHRRRAYKQNGLLTQSEAARLVGRSRERIRQLTVQGRLELVPDRTYTQRERNLFLRRNDVLAVFGVGDGHGS